MPLALRRNWQNWPAMLRLGTVLDEMAVTPMLTDVPDVMAGDLLKKRPRGVFTAAVSGQEAGLLAR
jgi:hypothetical protein